MEQIMKNYIKVYGIVLTFLLLNYSISLAESEPNNELAQATALSINSSDNGSLTYILILMIGGK